MKDHLLFIVNFQLSTTKDIFTPDHLKSLVSLAVENWSTFADTLESYRIKQNIPLVEKDRNHYLTIQSHRQNMKSRILDYHFFNDDKNVTFTFDINKIIENETIVSAKFWEDRYLQDFSKNEKSLFDFIDGFVESFYGEIMSVHFNQCRETKNYTDLPEIEIKVVNQKN